MKKAGIAIICAAFIVIMGTGFAFAANAAHSAPMVPMVDSATGGGRTIAETFADYEDYGISYERKADGSDNMGNIYYNGQPVKTFIDEKNDDA